MIKPYFKLLNSRRKKSVSYTPLQVASMYHFPSPKTGLLQGIALIELGGGYVQSDIDAYFKNLGIPAPTVHFISIDGAKNSPDGANGAQGEVMLDICVAGGVTQGTVPIYVVMAPNSTKGFADAIMWAANSPDITAVSISWGGPENTYSKSDINLMENAIGACFKAGKPVFSASGDSGSSDGESGNHVDYPASSPNAIGCGGTNLQSTKETVWNDGSKGGATGGGISVLFPVPSWQPATSIPGKGRATPDVAGNADPSTGWIVMVGGKNYVFGGTSAVSPMYAGLSCLINQNLGKNVGFPAITIYKNESAFNDIVKGNNGTYIAKTGFDCCSGLGSCNGQKLLTIFG